MSSVRNEIQTQKYELICVSLSGFEAGEETRSKLLLYLEELSCLGGAELIPYSQVNLKKQRYTHK